MNTTSANTITITTQHRAFYQHWHRLNIRAADLDDQDHVNNTVFATYCEEGRRIFLQPQISYIRSSGLLLFVVHLAIDFHREMSFPGEVEIGTTVTHVGNSSYKMAQALFTPQGCHATAEIITVIGSSETRRATPIPTPLREFLNAQINNQQGS